MKEITSYWCKRPIHVTRIIIGDMYEYQPVNPAATRNRGRQCILIAYGDGKKYEDSDNNATVKWLDTKRQGFVNVANLIHIDDMKKTPEQRADYAKKRSDAAKEQLLKEINASDGTF